MPDERISLQKLKDHFRRLWAVYLAGFALLWFANSLVYDVTRPGFSDDETLKIMLLNTSAAISEEELLQEVEFLGFKAVEMVELAVLAGDPMGEVQLAVQLTGGYGDIWIADEAGLDMLAARGVCLPLEESPGEEFALAERAEPESGEIIAAAIGLQPGVYMAVAGNGTNTQSALAALKPLAEMMG